MAPTNTKSYREIGVDVKNLDYDPAKKRMRLRTELGYNIIFEVEPHISVNNSEPFNNGVPEFNTNIVLRPINIEKGKDPMSKEDIDKLLSTRDVIPSDLDYENFTVGFVYANQQNPQNHKYMLEFRKQQKIFWAMHFLGVSLKKVPISTTSWHDGVYHGRFKVEKDSVGKVLETKAGHIVIQGKELNKTNPVSDFSKIIPNDIVNLRLRYNIREDYWYGDLLKKDQVISDLDPLKIRSIVSENVDFEGVADFGFEKPKVYYLTKVGDLADVKLMAETLFLVGRGE